MSTQTRTQDPRAEVRDRALERAQQIRQARAELRRKLQRGELFAASLLLEPPDEARTWAIGDLIARQRGWGRVTCRKLLARLNIPATKPLEALSERQRRDLLHALGRPRPGFR